MLVCVPNFSFGTGPTRFGGFAASGAPESNQMAAATPPGPPASLAEHVSSVARHRGASILDIHSDPDHNRTVITLAQQGEGIVESVVAAAEVAFEFIDINTHVGVHPRLGVADVIPFVPVGGASMDDAIKAALDCAERLHAETGVPCFLYEAAARPGRPRDLPAIRRSAFKGLVPDIGDPRPHPTLGVAVVGARKPLVAYNVRLDSRDFSVARQIAHAIRGPHVRALGFELASKESVQVSCNLTSPGETTIGDVYDAIRAMASELGVAIADAEVVGLVTSNSITGRDYASLGLSAAPKILEDETDSV